MFNLSKQFTFEASHRLPQHDGKCARLHGHSWKGRVTCSGERLQDGGPKAGMLIDYAEIGQAVKAIVEQSLDHWHLNDSIGLDNPTSEEIARWLYRKLKPALPSLSMIEIEETCTSRCQYSE